MRRRLLSAAIFAAALADAQTPAYRAPRADGGKPDLNGIWQALNEAAFVRIAAYDGV